MKIFKIFIFLRFSSFFFYEFTVLWILRYGRVRLRRLVEIQRSEKRCPCTRTIRDCEASIDRHKPCILGKKSWTTSRRPETTTKQTKKKQENEPHSYYRIFPFLKSLFISIFISVPPMPTQREIVVDEFTNGPTIHRTENRTKMFFQTFPGKVVSRTSHRRLRVKPRA